MVQTELRPPDERTAMKEMRLISLSLRNFKGIREFTLPAGGKDIAIFGDNGTGKTTLYDAWLWLLFGKDSANRADFEVKTLDAQGVAIPQIEHEVSATLDIGATENITLRKVLSEKWTGKRGSPTKTFTGHTTEYWINGVPITEGGYKAYIANLIDESAFRLLTNPRHFPDVLKWQERRQILMSVCGDVSDGDVIASDPTLGGLPGILKGRKLDDHRKVIQSRQTEINKDLKTIPVRIDEQERAKPTLGNAGIKAVDIQAQRDALRQTREAKLQEKAQVEAGGGVAEKRKALSQLESESLDFENTHRHGLERQIADVRAVMSKTQVELDDARRSIANGKRELADHEATVARQNTRLQELRAQWQTERDRAFAYEETTACPACGQSLPAEKVEAARNKAQGQFNTAKAQALERISKEAEALKAQMQTEAGADTHLAADIENLEAGIPSLEKSLADAQSKINALSAQMATYKQSPKFTELGAKMESLRQEIAALKEGTGEAVAVISREIAALDTQIADHEKTLAQITQRENCETRITELAKQQKALAAEYERLEKELYLTEQFVRSKVRLLEERINSRFKLARFRMFTTLVNGGLEECCEVLLNGVPYSGNLSNSQRINVGLDIINTLSEFYGFAPPIFVDNCEGVTKPLSTTGQQIRLYVSESDKVLRVEEQ